MKVVQLTPGSGDTFYCENCLRDHALTVALRQLGHDALVTPLYLPVALQEPGEIETTRLFMGGVNVYLQQMSRLFARTPHWLDRLWDAPWLLRQLGKRAGATSPKVLAETTLSMLRGEQGRQVKELERLVAFLRDELQPDIVCLSNGLLIGLARRIKAALGVPVACMLQDEDEFLDDLPEPQRQQAWELFAERAQEVDRLLACSQFYADFMAKRLAVPPEKMRVIRPGLTLSDDDAVRSAPAMPTIGYLSRMYPSKGLDVLAEAFIQLKQQGGLEDVRLVAAGGLTKADVPYVRGVQQRLRRAGVWDDVEFMAGYAHDVRREFFAKVSLLCVPERRGPAYARYVLEALAAGVPVVAPAIGAFKELLQMTGGGVLYPPGTPEAAPLVEALEPILRDGDKGPALVAQAQPILHSEFDITISAQRLATLYEEVIETR